MTLCPKDFIIGAATVRNDNPRLLVRQQGRRDQRVAQGQPPSPIKVTVTEHGDLVGASVTDALQRLALKHVIPVIHEVLLLDTEEQAEERCLGATINRGTEAARVAMNMVQLFKKMRQAFGITRSSDFQED